MSSRMSFENMVFVLVVGFIIAAFAAAYSSRKRPK
jgi:hypothetical protein